MKDLEISKNLKNDIEFNQLQLQSAIKNHQQAILRLKDDPDNLDIQKEIDKAENIIIAIGLKQKPLLDRLREECRNHRKSIQIKVIKNGMEERRFNLSNALNRARKQNVALIRSASVTSSSDDSVEALSINSSPEQQNFPLDPQDLSQSEFLNYFNLATHDVFKEMQNKRAERKRRSTANPHFLYGNKGWEMFQQGKRKRGPYLISPVSPPNTRQSVRKKAERVSPPLPSAAANNQQPKSNGFSNNSGNTNNNNQILNGNNSNNSPVELKNIFPFPTIPNLPSGLIIERINPGSSTADNKICGTCKQPGALSVCEVCSSNFHVSCHNRPFAQTPRQCPRCITKETRTVGSLNVPSGMTVSYISTSTTINASPPSEVSEKLKLKQQLLKDHNDLTAELTQLQDRHSQLTISLKNQANHKEKLIADQQTTEEKIQHIIKFIDAMKKPIVIESDSEDTS